MHCPRCNAKLGAERNLCSNCALVLIRTEDLGIQKTENGSSPALFSVDEYALSTDRTACKALEGSQLLMTAVEWLLSHWDKLRRAELLGGAVRVGPGQIPSLDSIVKSESRFLGIQPPELFVLNDPTFNAYTFGTNDDHVVVIHSGLIDAYQLDELAFIIGHELGHIRSRHVTYGTIAQLIAGGAVAFFSQALFFPLKITLDAWNRESEVTCDRAGYLLSGDEEASLRALLLLALGSRKLLPEVDLRAYVRQEEDLKDFYGTAKRWLVGSDHPFTVTRVRRLMEFACSERGKTLAARARTRMEQDWVDFAHIPLGSPGGGPPLLPVLSRQATNRSFCKECGFELRLPLPIQCPVCSTNTLR
jgi:Zn-dependent protease with chaperone function